MTVVFCMLFPAFAGVFLVWFYQRKVADVPRPPLWAIYGGLVLVSNTVVYLVLAFVMGHRTLFLEENAFHLTFSLRYIGLSLVVTLGTAWAWCLFASRRLRLQLCRADRPASKALGTGRKILREICFLVVLVSIVLLFGSQWLVDNFNDLTPDKLIFHVFVPLEGADQGLVTKYLLGGLLPALVCFALLTLWGWLPLKREFRLAVSYRERGFSFALLPLGALRHFFEAFTALLLVFALLFANSRLNFSVFIAYFGEDSTFIEDHYANPDTTALTFPKEKRNLIFIYMESMEATFLSRELGGVCGSNLIPDITTLAEENTSFGATLVGSILPGAGTQWTIAAMSAAMSGLPLRVSTMSPDGNDYGTYAAFMPGALMLGDILADEGYNQMFMMGSNAAFGGRDALLREHGGYTIKDYDAAVKDGLIPEDYYVWWGFEDKHLYSYARQELAGLAARDEPFNFSLLTVDTHNVGGYVCDLCQNVSTDQYNNVIACASRQVLGFVRWIQDQDFYENTTVIIIGDHVSMDPGDISKITAAEDYPRAALNLIINAPAAPALPAHERQLATWDFFPTTLAAIGVEIEGDRLGLGTNLFSATPTLIEQYGLEAVNAQLNQRSTFYDETFLYGN